MGVSLIAGGRDRVDRVRSFLSGGVLDDVEALKDAQDMGVDGDAVLGEQVVHHQVSHFSADPLELQQALAVARNLAAMLLDDLAAQDLQIDRLAVVVRDRLDDCPEFFVI